MSTLADELKALFTATIADPVMKSKMEAYFDSLAINIQKKITVSDTAPPDPEANEIWIDTNP